MLDLSRYEGHSPAPWTDHGGIVGDIYPKTGLWPIVKCDPIFHRPDRDLILDAPLILAELREARQQLEIAEATIQELRQVGEKWELAAREAQAKVNTPTEWYRKGKISGAVRAAREAQFISDDEDIPYSILLNAGASTLQIVHEAGVDDSELEGLLDLFNEEGDLIW